MGLENFPSSRNRHKDTPDSSSLSRLRNMARPALLAFLLSVPVACSVKNPDNVAKSPTDATNPNYLSQVNAAANRVTILDNEKIPKTPEAVLLAFQVGDVTPLGAFRWLLGQFGWQYANLDISSPQAALVYLARIRSGIPERFLPLWEALHKHYRGENEKNHLLHSTISVGYNPYPRY